MKVALVAPASEVAAPKPAARRGEFARELHKVEEPSREPSREPARAPSIATAAAAATPVATPAATAPPVASPEAPPVAATAGTQAVATAGPDDEAVVPAGEEAGPGDAGPDLGQDVGLMAEPAVVEAVTAAPTRGKGAGKAGAKIASAATGEPATAPAAQGHAEAIAQGHEPGTPMPAVGTDGPGRLEGPSASSTPTHVELAGHRAKLIVGEGADRIVIDIALRGEVVDVRLRAMSDQLAQLARHGAGELDQSLRRSGLQLGEHHASSDASSSSSPDPGAGPGADPRPDQRGGRRPHAPESPEDRDRPARDVSTTAPGDASTTARPVDPRLRARA